MYICILYSPHELYIYIVHLDYIIYSNNIKGFFCGVFFFNLSPYSSKKKEEIFTHYLMSNER